MTFGERLKQLRKENSMSLDAVAEKVGLTRPTIYRYENGIIENVPPERVHQLANLFGVTRPYLMGWTDERNVNPSENLDMVAEKLREPHTVHGRTSGAWKPANASDSITAATQALRVLAKFKIGRTPIYPQQILQASSMATLITFGDETGRMVVSPIRKGQDRNEHYIFEVNRNAPIGELSLMLAINIGHIYLGHTDPMDTCARRKESECFAIHLRFPRPMIRILEERGYVFTQESFARIFGYCDPCMESILNAPPVSTSPELNRLVKEQFVPYADKLEDVGVLSMPVRGDKLDLSKYMDGYEE